MRTAVITGTTREGRISGLVAEWVTGHLAQHPDVEVEGIDLRDHPLPFFDGIAPARTGRDYPREDVAGLGRLLDQADGFVVLSAEYNHGYPAVLKNAMDWTFVEWRHKPITFVAWGNVGGARAVEQLRQVAVEFEMAPLRHAVHILPDVLVPAIRAGADATVESFTSLDERLDRMIDDLLWWMRALSPARALDPS
jgi:NAD(P)H-dependent FMN reductase